MKTQTVKTLQLSGALANKDEQLGAMIGEVLRALELSLCYGTRERIVQFSVEVERKDGGSDKWQYARRDA